MTSRWAGMAIRMLLAVAGLYLGAGCDPCPSCSSSHPVPPPPPPNACLPSSSLSVLVQGKNATAYLPQGNWGGGTASVKVVPIETSAGIGTGGPPTTVAVGSVPNSCSSNSTTGGDGMRRQRHQSISDQWHDSEYYRDQRRDLD